MEINKCNKLVCNLYDKNNYAVNIRSLKQALNHGLGFRRVIQFNQKAWLKEYIDMNTELRKQAKNDFEKDLINSCVFGNTVENLRKYRDIKLVTTDNRRNQLVSEPSYKTAKWFSENLEAIKMKKAEVKLNKPIYLEFSISDLSEIVMYEFLYDYIKPKYSKKAKYRKWIQTVL